MIAVSGKRTSPKPLNPSLIKYISNPMQALIACMQVLQKARAPLHADRRLGGGDLALAGSGPSTHHVRRHFDVALKRQAFTDHETLIAAVATP